MQTNTKYTYELLSQPRKKLHKRFTLLNMDLCQQSSYYLLLQITENFLVVYQQTVTVLMSNININSLIKRKDGLVEAQIDGETVMMDIESGNYYGLDLVATRIWQMIEQPQSVQNLCSQLLLEYEVSEQQCQQDVISFLNKMRANQTIEIASD